GARRSGGGAALARRVRGLPRRGRRDLAAAAVRPPPGARCRRVGGRGLGMSGRAAQSEPILHVDLDAFYASVETQKDPSFAGKPVAVGGTGNRGVVMSASYEARAFGVRSAMPAVRARRLCPQIVFLPPDFESYRTYSNRFREVLLSFTPLVEPLALDEAFLDVGGAQTLFGEPATIAERIRADVAGELGFACSVGVAPNKFLAKLAATRAKPDGLLVVRSKAVRAFLDPPPVGSLWGAGETPTRT